MRTTAQQAQPLAVSAPGAESHLSAGSSTLTPPLTAAPANDRLDFAGAGAGSTRSLCRTLHAHAAKAAITTKQLTPHCLRRTAATHMLQGDASLRAIQLILGHRDLATTSAYLRLDTRDLRRELHLKHPRERIDA